MHGYLIACMVYAAQDTQTAKDTIQTLARFSRIHM